MTGGKRSGKSSRGADSPCHRHIAKGRVQRVDEQGLAPAEIRDGHEQCGLIALASDIVDLEAIVERQQPATGDALVGIELSAEQVIDPSLETMAFKDAATTQSSHDRPDTSQRIDIDQERQGQGGAPEQWRTWQRERCCPAEDTCLTPLPETVGEGCTSRCDATQSRRHQGSPFRVVGEAAEQGHQTISPSQVGEFRQYVFRGISGPGQSSDDRARRSASIYDRNQVLLLQRPELTQ